MILSIESSCDDSSIAITSIDTLELIYHKKISQELQHSVYGGVVPELASRLHIEALPKILQECKIYFNRLKAIAVTNAPGLSVTLIEGVTMAKALSISLNIPLIAVNHLKGHIYSTWIEKKDQLPCTVLLVSGGHTQIIEVKSLDDMKIVGQTIDDSFGESFDKVAKMLNLGYPGGPIVQQYAYKGDSKTYNFPIPLKQSPKIEFSYSGLKNAVRLAVLDELSKAQDDKISQDTISNICASFQETAVEHIMMKLRKYCKINNLDKLAVVGGASANLTLRSACEELCNRYDAQLILAPLEFCSDNGAMIGRVAIEQFHKKDFIKVENISVSPRLTSF